MSLRRGNQRFGNLDRNQRRIIDLSERLKPLVNRTVDELPSWQQDLLDFNINANVKNYWKRCCITCSRRQKECVLNVYIVINDFNIILMRHLHLKYWTLKKSGLSLKSLFNLRFSTGFLEPYLTEIDPKWGEFWPALFVSVRHLNTLKTVRICSECVSYFSCNKPDSNVTDIFEFSDNGGTRKQFHDYLYRTESGEFHILILKA